jgi:hypothetical protein
MLQAEQLSKLGAVLTDAFLSTETTRRFCLGRMSIHPVHAVRELQILKQGTFSQWKRHITQNTNNQTPNTPDTTPLKVQ